jgi:hypothetical protein
MKVPGSNPVSGTQAGSLGKLLMTNQAATREGGALGLA